MNIDTITREEQYLNRLTGETDQAIPEPETRKEQYLSRLCGADNIIPETPITREEQYLASLCGEEVEMPEPETRLEQYMAFAGGERKNKPEPITRKEQLWDKYQGGAVPEEKTVSGTLIHVTDAVEEPATKLAVTMEPKQEATPFVGETTTEPYLSKTASTTGNKRYLDKIVGGTVAWNQIIGDPNFVGGWWLNAANATVTYNNNVAEIIVSEGASTNYFLQKSNISFYKNHKYFISYDAKADSNGSTSTGGMFTFSSGQSAAFSFNHALTDDWERYSTVVNSSDNITGYLRLGFKNSDISGQFKYYLRNAVLIDLTLMFSNAPEIVDYVYSLEQATAGAGVQWLKDHGFIDDLYKAYNPGELISAKPTAFTVGSNTYALGGVDLKGLFKLDAQNNLYCDGDIYPPSGQISGKYGIVDLGTLNWNYNGTIFYTNPGISDIKTGVSNTLPLDYIICGRYVNALRPGSGILSDKQIGVGTSGGYSTKVICVKDSTYTDEQTFTTAMNRVYLVYELETPTTSSSTPYTNPAPISNSDTEYFTDSRVVPIPCGNESHYAGEYPIEGKTGLTVNHAQTQEDKPTTYSITFTEQGTVYGGTVDIVTGALSITWGYIASYNGETLTGRWISSLDVYAEGTTPTTGAEVAYELASPITAELTPQEVQMLLGENYFWAENGESIELTYKARAAQRVLAMNSKLNLNKQALELKRSGGVIIDKPIIKPIGGAKL